MLNYLLFQEIDPNLGFSQLPEDFFDEPGKIYVI